MTNSKKRKYLNKEDALKKLQRYCTYQDRCHKEVRSKLLDLGVYGDDLEGILVDLIQDDFLNEERFACSFVRGKFRIKHWGKNRLVKELKQRQISEYCIKKAMEEIEEEDYLQTLREVLKKKDVLTKTPENPFKRQAKIAQYAIQRGFEAELVWKVLKSAT